MGFGLVCACEGRLGLSLCRDKKGRGDKKGCDYSLPSWMRAALWLWGRPAAEHAGPRPLCGAGIPLGDADALTSLLTPWISCLPIDCLCRCSQGRRQQRGQYACNMTVFVPHFNLGAGCFAV